MTEDERLSDAEIQMHLQHIGLCLPILMRIPTHALLHEFSLNDALGVLIDPTGWMAIRDNASKNERVVQALAAFQAVIRKEWPEVEAKIAEQN